MGCGGVVAAAVVVVERGGSPVYFFHSESTPSSSPLSLCVTAGVGNVKGRTKTEPAVQPGSAAASDATPAFPKPTRQPVLGGGGD